MLDTLRQNSRSALIYVFFGIIILVFVFSFGPGSNGCRSGSLTTGGSIAAKVNGKTIPLSAFEQTYARSYREYSQRAGGAFSEDLARMMKLRDKALDKLVDAELLAQAAEAQGIVVSDTELADSIKKMPAFQKDGAFNHEQYELIIQRQLGTIPGVFEEEIRRSMLAQKLVAGLVEDAKVSDDEVRAAFAKEKEKVDLGFVRFSPASLRAEVAKPTDAQVDALLKDKHDRVDEYFKQNSARFNKPQRVHARHILVKVDENAPAAEVDAAKKKAEEARAKVTGGADFATVAKEMSDDPGSKEKGGDLGVFGPGTMDPAFQKAAFALKENEVSQVVRTRFGFHVIKVESVLPEEKKALKDVEREIASDILVDDGAKELAKKQAEAAIAEVRSGKKLEALFPAAEKKEDGEPVLAAISKPEYDTTGSFSPGGEYIPKIGVDKDLLSASLALSEQAPVPEKPFEINGSYYVVALKSREHADMKELETKMAEFRDTARLNKASQLVDAFVANLRTHAKVETNPAVLEGQRGPAAVDEG